MSATAKQPARLGSEASRKQITQAVKDEKLVLFKTSASDEVEGFVIGMDDYHWIVYTPDGSITTLVHKSAPSVRVTDRTLDDVYPLTAQKIRTVTAPFREHVMGTYFGQTPKRDET